MKYFASYAYRGNSSQSEVGVLFGNGVFTMKQVIKTERNIRALEEKIADRIEMDATVLSFQLIS